MQIIYNEAGAVYTSTKADDFMFSFLMGYECQGHGHVRVRGFPAFVKYLRMQYDWDLRTAVGVTRAWEAARPLPDHRRVELDLTFREVA